jgi:hypothetical protein
MPRAAWGIGEWGMTIETNPIRDTQQAMANRLYLNSKLGPMRDSYSFQKRLLQSQRVLIRMSLHECSGEIVSSITSH